MNWELYSDMNTEDVISVYEGRLFLGQKHTVNLPR